MSEEPNSKSDFSGADDPRVRSFLRQAAAIIASTRGLNEESRLKLRALADHIDLSDEQYDRSLLHLKQSDHAAFQLNHWEKDFVDQIKKKFSSLPQNILKVSTENRIILIAGDKYQINEIRARQLIDHYVEQLGVGRVSEADAREYVSRSVDQGIGEKASISGEQRENFYDVGRNWGLEREVVEEIILERLQGNRVAFQSSHSWLKAVVVILIVVLAFGGAAIIYWQPGWLGVGPRPSIPTESDSEKLLDSIGVPAWWSESTSDRVKALVSSKRLKTFQIELLSSQEADKRLEALSELLENQLANSRDSDLDQSIAGMLSDEPSTDVFRAAVNKIIEKLSPAAPDFPNSIRGIKKSFRANEILGDWLYDGAMSEKRFSDRGASDFQLQSRVMRYWNLDSIPESTDAYLGKTEPKLAIQCWTHLANSSWASPSRAAILLEPLIELTSHLIDPDELNQYRSRVLMSILENETIHWREVTASVIDAVERADEVNVQEWIRLFEKGNNRDWVIFIGAQLAKKLEVSANKDLSAELGRIRKEFSQKKYRTLIEKSKLVSELATSALDEVNLKGNLNRPDIIAKLAYAANVLLVFENETPHSFQQSDLAVTKGLPVLRDLVGLDEEKITRPILATTPTALEIKEKKRLFERLTVATNSPTSKRSALNQLAELAIHFDDISYVEAEILAVYVLGSLDLESTLNIEKNLSSFAHWSNFGLAIADLLPITSVPLDHAITVATLQQGRQFNVTDRDNWRTDLKDDILLSIEHGLRQRLEKNPSPIQLDWRRLQIHLPEVYRTRRMILSDQSDASESRSMTADIEALIRIVNARVGDTSQSLHRLLTLMWSDANNELERVVVANQLFLDALAAASLQEFSNAHFDIRAIVDDFHAAAKLRNSNGERLLLLERALVRLLLLRHQKDLERRINAT